MCWVRVGSAWLRERCARTGYVVRLNERARFVVEAPDVGVLGGEYACAEHAKRAAWRDLRARVKRGSWSRRTVARA